MTYTPYADAIASKIKSWSDLETDLWRYAIMMDGRSYFAVHESDEPRIVIQLKVEN